VDKNKHSHIGNRKAAFDIATKLIEETPNISLTIVEEEYCEFGHSDSGCHLTCIFVYEDGKITRNIYMLK